MSQFSSNEQRFKALINASADVVYQMSPDWEFMYELDGKDFFSSTNEPTRNWRTKNVHPDDLNKVDQAVKTAIETGNVFELEHRVIRKDGSVGWTFSKAIPIVDEAGKIIEWFGSASDITARKHAEEQLRIAKEQAEKEKRIYETITSSTPDLVYVFELDYTFSYANRALLEMWGKSWDEAIGKNLLENGYEPWHAEMHEREIDQIVTTKKSIRGEVAFPHAVLGKRIYDYILNPVFNASGDVIAIAGTTRDVTERKAHELEILNLSDNLAALNEETVAANEELNAANEELLKSKERLTEANSNLALILDMLPASVVVIRGDDLVVEMINTSNLTYWNKTANEVLGKPFLEILPDLADQPFAGQLREVMRSGQTLSVKESPVLFREADGSIRETYVDYSYQPLQDANGNRNGVLVMSFEITDRVMSRRLLEQYVSDLGVLNQQLSVTNNDLVKSEARFKFLIHEAPVAIGVLHGRNMVIETANQKLLEVWGKNQSAIGKPLEQALPELVGQPFLGILDNVYTSGEPYHWNEVRAQLEHEGELKDFFFNAVYQPVPDASGQIADILIVALDVTPQVNARLQVEQAEHTLRLAIEAANVGTWSINAETRELVASPRLKELFGFHPDEEITMEDAIGQITETYRDAVSAQIEHVLKNGGDYDLSYTVQGHRDKKLRWVRALGNLSKDVQGDFSAFTGVIMDITNQKQDEIRKNDFIGMVSHELKTPLTSLSGYLQILQRRAKKEGNENLASSYEQPLKQVKQMAAMINGFLNVSRFDSGKIHIEKSDFDMEELLKETKQEQLSMFGSHEIVFEELQSVNVRADRSKIAQVINNLVSNAAKYSPAGTSIRISSELRGEWLRVSISDEGIGIREEDVDRLFERYYRVESNNNVSGFGIGLYLSAEIINHHQGRIWAESSLGKGSTFFFELPGAKAI